MPDLLNLPSDAVIRDEMQTSWFADCHSVMIAYQGQSALSLFLQMAAQTPAWIDGLMWMRNKLVSMFGLKDLGLLGALDSQRIDTDYQIGERVGIFTLAANRFHEVLLQASRQPSQRNP
ncbi:DUF2867 domain-containing protein [Bowmanella denitrificans]|uniref:DUF2867 domain-containing protein n=1 Tax=Bowmanella denitrificans TaxID=366582 RepID=UPI000C9A6557|nr:DUF2867 domain-containing protein [Bowmanella denitrificans]